MRLSMQITMDDMLRALRGRVHTLAEEVVLTGRTDTRETRGEASPNDNLRTGMSRDDRARR